MHERDGVSVGEPSSTASNPGDPAAGGFVPWRYPTELEADVVTRDGSILRLRPIRPDDAEQLVNFHGLLSFDSIYRRYFSMHPHLTPEEVEHYTRVDYVDRLALVIVEGDQLVAVGRYDRYPSTSRAEVAFLVLDDHQNIGLGPSLLQHLAEAAWERGITEFTAETLATNRNMMAVFRSSGFPVTSHFEDGEISVSFSIEPTEESRRRRADHQAGTV
ncbi:MAG: GNAT family N-acetyltransferase [Acidimicrobiales bacterium]|jgi:GNAT superfamily N-acetyltransferase